VLNRFNVLLKARPEFIDISIRGRKKVAGLELIWSRSSELIDHKFPAVVVGTHPCDDQQELVAGYNRQGDIDVVPQLGFDCARLIGQL
jgi:hypothetical protein